MKKLFYFVLVFLFIAACKQAFNPPDNSPATGYLVVDGFISSGSAPSSFTLSRTVKLNSADNAVFETGASLTIEGESNGSYPLQEASSGVYVSASLSLSNSEKYHLHIKTKDGKDYLSDFVVVKTGPPIDSISWKRDGGVQLYINTHDDENKTRYYQWKYEETWEFYSNYQSSLDYQKDDNNNVTGVVYKNPATQEADTTVYRCWNTINSTSITLGSTEKLSRDLIFLPLVYIEPASVKLSSLYSINLRQYALSKEAYNFLEKMKKNTEQLGSVFDPQPSELQGNIHCVTNPAEVVIGYVDVTEEKLKRIFISKREVPDWGYKKFCSYVEIDNQADSIRKYGLSLLPVSPTQVNPFGGIVKFVASDPGCIDCTISGTNVKPDFWP